VTPEEFRRIGHELIDRIADYRAGIAARPVMSPNAPGALRAALPGQPPQHAEPFAAIFSDLDALIIPGVSNWQHPNFFGYFPANSELSSVLGDYLSTGLGVLGLSWQASPPITELEEVVVDWMRQIVGLSDAWSGVIQDTASTSTLVALICARERASGYGLASGGLQSSGAPLVVYVSSHAHSSVDKGALLAGFGRDNIRMIDVDAGYAMRPEALDAAIEADIAAGRRPCVVVATIGTTSTTAIDPLEQIGAAVRRHDVWLHVDAAMAGSAMILPECRWMWRGVRLLALLRPRSRASRSRHEHQSQLPSIERRWRGEEPSLALKLWCLLRAEGVVGLQARLRRDLDNTRWLAREVSRTPGWKILAPVPLQTLCVRHEPVGLAGDALDRHTLAWVEAVNSSGRAYLTPATLDGRWMARVSVGALTTEREHVAAIWRLLQEEVGRAGAA
jgi:aromatic-L-amino-acid/L-tryptophan decarboxylase